MDIFLIYFSMGSLVLPLGAFINRRLQRRILVQFDWLIVLFVLSEIVSISSMRWIGFNTYFYLHIYTIVEFTLIALIFYDLKVIKGQRLLTLIIGGFAVIGIVGLLYQGWDQPNSIARSVESFTLTGISLFALYSRLTGFDSKMTSEGGFWFEASIFLYFGGSFFIFLLSSNWMAQINPFIVNTFILLSCLNITKNVFLAVALLKWSKNSTTRLSL